MKLEDQLRRAIQRGMIQFDSPLAPRDMLTKKRWLDGAEMIKTAKFAIARPRNLFSTFNDHGLGVP